MINCLHTRVVSKVDMHMGAGPECGLDYFTFAVEHMSGTVENVLAPTLVANNESFGRLIACSLASFNRCGWACSRHCDSLFYNSYSNLVRRPAAQSMRSRQY